MIRVERSRAAMAVNCLFALLLAGRASAQVTFELGAVTAAPGQTDVSVPLSIDVEPGAPDVLAWTFAMRYDPSALGAVEVENAREADFYVFRDQADLVLPGRVAAACAYVLGGGREERNIGSENDGVVARMRFCVLPDAPAGRHALSFTFHAEQVDSPAISTGYDDVIGRHFPRTVDGSVTVDGAPAGGACPRDEHTLGGEPTEPREVILTLGDAMAAPGETGVTLPVSVHIEAGAPPVQGWSLVFRQGPEGGGVPPPLAGISIASTREADFFVFHDQASFVEPGLAGASVVYSVGGMEPERSITAETDGTVATVSFCVPPETAPGLYFLDPLPFAHQISAAGVATLYTAEGRSRTPLIGVGSVRVEGPSIGGETCEPDEHEPVPPRPPELEATFKLEGGSALRGGEVTVPFIMNANAEAQAFSFSIDFDEEVLEAAAIEEVFRRLDGEPWDFRVFTFQNENATPGNGGVDEGFLVGAAVFALELPDAGPRRDTDTTLLDFRFRVRPDARLGTTEITFLDGAAFPSSPPAQNNVTLYGETASITYETRPVFVNGLLGIVGDITTFRGDSNGDERLDLSDAISTLEYLFQGAVRPLCLHAADANADGAVNISDPVSTLMFLFTGSEAVLPEMVSCNG